MGHYILMLKFVGQFLPVSTFLRPFILGTTILFSFSLGLSGSTILIVCFCNFVYYIEIVDMIVSFDTFYIFIMVILKIYFYHRFYFSYK